MPVLLMRRTSFVVIVLLALFAGQPSLSQSTPASRVAFQPYYASLRSNEVNIRVGPSKDHPITWVYHRQGLPVQVIDVHNEWRNILDPEGDKGWVKKSLLSPRRTVITIAAKSMLRTNPSPSATIVAMVEKYVVCPVRTCTLHWCQVDAGSYRGWVEKTSLWGLKPAEIIE